MADDNARRQADALLRHGDPDRTMWKRTGAARTRRLLWWSWEEREETRLVYSVRKGWWLKHRWVRQ